LDPKLVPDRLPSFKVLPTMREYFPYHLKILVPEFLLAIAWVDKDKAPLIQTCYERLLPTAFGLYHAGSLFQSKGPVEQLEQEQWYLELITECRTLRDLGVYWASKLVDFHHMAAAELKSILEGNDDPDLAEDLVRLAPPLRFHWEKGKLRHMQEVEGDTSKRINLQTIDLIETRGTHLVKVLSGVASVAKEQVNWRHQVIALATQLDRYIRRVNSTLAFYFEQTDQPEKADELCTLGQLYRRQLPPPARSSMKDKEPKPAEEPKEPEESKGAAEAKEPEEPKEPAAPIEPEEPR
jgi:hypothetical protein